MYKSRYRAKCVARLPNLLSSGGRGGGGGSHVTPVFSPPSAVNSFSR